jgi:LuxR family transcriptional regulator, maltose regulon positive regulatory protein
VRAVRRKGFIGSLAGATAPLVVVSAPSGAGKTLAVCQWLEVDERPAAWLHLDRGDNDPVTLLQYVAGALRRVTPLDPAVHSWLCLPQPPVQQVIVPTLAAAAAAGPPFVLVLDDVHVVREPRCWAVLWPILDTLSPSSAAVLCGRADPLLPLPRLRAEERLAEFRYEQLAFGRDEVRELMMLHGLTPEAIQVERLLEATEGWAAGLYLGALALKRRGAVDLPARPTDGQSDMVDYLADEVLAEQPQEVVEFLTRTSIVDRLSPALCDDLTGRGDGVDMLHGIERENLFIVRLDDGRGWYRYHHLFAQMLQAELRRREPTAVTELNRRAAAWFEAEDQVRHAVRHWVAAGELARAGDLVAARWRSRQDGGRLLSARLWLDELGPGQELAHPPLTVAAAWLRALTGEPTAARSLLTALDPEVLDAPSPDGAASLRSSAAALDALLGTGGPEGMRANAGLAVELECRSGRGTLWLDFASHLLGVGEALCGDVRVAVEALLRAAGRGSGIQSGVELAALGHLSLMAGDEGRWEEAEGYAAQAALLASAYDIEDYLPSVPARLARDRLRARAGDEDAAADLEELLRSLDPTFCQWLGPLAALLLAEVAMQRNDASAVQRWLGEARERLARWSEAPGITRRTEQLERLCLMRLRVEQISDAERRVLELLPTHLTIREIGARLGVSPNTVSSHVASLHRKLGVTSRSETVARAIELGLLAVRPPSD